MLKARKWLNFPTPPCLRPSLWEPLRMSGWNLASENHNRGATRRWRNHDASFLGFDTIPARDGQTDGRTDRRTDTLRSQRPALAQPHLHHRLYCLLCIITIVRGLMIKFIFTDSRVFVLADGRDAADCSSQCLDGFNLRPFRLFNELHCTSDRLSQRQSVSGPSHRPWRHQWRHHSSNRSVLTSVHIISAVKTNVWTRWAKTRSPPSSSFNLRVVNKKAVLSQENSYVVHFWAYNLVNGRRLLLRVFYRHCVKADLNAKL